MDKPSDVRRLVVLAGVRHASGVGHLAMVAVMSLSFGHSGRDVCRCFSEFANKIVSYVEATVQHLELFVRRQGGEEARRCRTVECGLQGTWARGNVHFVEARMARYWSDGPLKEKLLSYEGELEGFRFAITGYLDAASVVEDYVDLGVFP